MNCRFCPLLLVTALVLASCVDKPAIRREGDRVVLAPSEQPNIDRVAEKLMTLVPAGDPLEARRIAEAAVLRGAELAEKYGVNLPPAEHNLLVNFGLRPRGLCWQWTWDMAAALEPIHPRTFDFHWGASNETRYNEHNTVVVTAKGQPFVEGVMLDPWRSSGRITAIRLNADREYKWSKRQPPEGAPKIFRREG